MKTIYRTEHDGLVGIIVGPDNVEPGKPLIAQLRVIIGFEQDAPYLEAEEFEPRARLVVLELRNYLREEFGMDEKRLR